MNRGPLAGACIVDKAVEPPKSCHCKLYGLLWNPGRGYVGRENFDVSDGRQFPSEAPKRLWPACNGDDPVALLRKAPCNRLADSGARAGDQYDRPCGRSSVGTFACPALLAHFP